MVSITKHNGYTRVARWCGTVFICLRVRLALFIVEEQGRPNASLVNFFAGNISDFTKSLVKS